MEDKAILEAGILGRGSCIRQLVLIAVTKPKFLLSQNQDAQFIAGNATGTIRSFSGI